MKILIKQDKKKKIVFSWLTPKVHLSIEIASTIQASFKYLCLNITNLLLLISLYFFLSQIKIMHIMCFILYLRAYKSL